jgi:hypothetical protein
VRHLIPGPITVYGAVEKINIAASDEVGKVIDPAVFCVASARRAAILRKLFDPARVVVLQLGAPKLGRRFSAVYAFFDEFGESEEDPVTEYRSNWLGEIMLGLGPGCPYEVTLL